MYKCNIFYIRDIIFFL